MTAVKIKQLIEDILRELPERMSGNEAYPYVATKLESLVATDKKSILQALRSYLAFRVAPKQRTADDAVDEARIWMALEVTVRLSLVELRPDIELLIADVRNGKVFLPVHEKSVARYLNRLDTGGIAK